ncbi:MAG: ABC transporter permease [Actinomycetota bacterium]
MKLEARAARSWAGGRPLELLRVLAVAEMRQSRDLTLLGMLKWVLEPLSYMAVYFVLVAAIFDRGREAYPLFLLAALVPFRYFTGVTTGAMGVVKSYGSVITNAAMPMWVLPLVLMVSELATLLLSLFVFVPFMIWYGVVPWPSVLWLPLLLVELMLLCSGPVYAATVFGLYVPHLRGASQNLIRTTFFVSTGLVAAAEVPGNELAQLVRLNPLSSLFESFRAVFLHGSSPALRDLLYLGASGLLMLALGAAVFVWRQHEFPKEV